MFNVGMTLSSQFVRFRCTLIHSPARLPACLCHILARVCVRSRYRIVPRLVHIVCVDAFFLMHIVHHSVLLILFHLNEATNIQHSDFKRLFMVMHKDKRINCFSCYASSHSEMPDSICYRVVLGHLNWYSSLFLSLYLVNARLRDAIVLLRFGSMTIFF